MDPKQPPTDYDRPVAYDAEGKPLYAHPPIAQTHAVHMVRPIEPDKLVISEETKRKHERSVQAYPDLNLSENEYIITSVRRHPFGVVLPLMLGVVLISLAFIFLLNFDSIINSFQFTGLSISSSIIVLPVTIFIGLVILGICIAYYVYYNNRFFLTNESIIQEIQTSIFSKREQTASLLNIEDVSYTKEGIIQQIFDFGSIRLSTEGDETTYRLSYVTEPKKTTALLNNAVEAYKNGRAISN